MAKSEVSELNSWYVIAWRYNQYSCKRYYTLAGFIDDATSALRFDTEDATRETIDKLHLIFPDAELQREKNKWSGRAFYPVKVVERVTVHVAEDE